MICWADITLPSSRVRSDAFRTNLLKRALLGRSVIGTVSGSLGSVFFAFGRVGAAGITCDLVGGAVDAKTGAGMEPVPAGWLAAAEMRAAKSLESRFFFIIRPMFGCAMVRRHDTVIAQHCNTTHSRMCGVTALCRRSVAILRHCGRAAAQRSGLVMLWHPSVSHLSHFDIEVSQCYDTIPSKRRAVVTLQFCRISTARHCAFVVL